MKIRAITFLLGLLFPSYLWACGGHDRIEWLWLELGLVFLTILLVPLALLKLKWVRKKRLAVLIGFTILFFSVGAGWSHLLSHVTAKCFEKEHVAPPDFVTE